jgi:methionyl-tRNA formyltransferase
MKTVFLGTPAWAVPSLEILSESSHRPALALTQPARRRGREAAPTPSPIAAAAAALGIACEMTESVRSAETLARLASIGADLFVVVAYGEILPRAVLEMPRLGCVNLHFSLLPRYRGAAPVQWAIADGAKETGVTTMRLVSKMDAGPVYLQEPVAIEAGERAPALGSRLAPIGAALLLETLDGIERGTLDPIDQDAAHVTYARMLTAEDGWIDWNLPAEAIVRRVHGFDPWPGQAALGKKGKIKIVEARAVPGIEGRNGSGAGVDTSGGEEEAPTTKKSGGKAEAAAVTTDRSEGKAEAEAAPAAPQPGCVLGTAGDGCRIACADGSVMEALVVRPEGRGDMTGAEAVRGRQLSVGDILGRPDGPRR